MAILGLVLAIGSPSRLSAADVWVQFGTEFETQLDTAASTAGVTAFSLAERSAIEGTILTEINRVFDGYNVDFATTDMGGTREILDFGPTTAAPLPSTLGVAPLDFGNRVGAGNSARIFTEKFGFHIESSDTRADQLHEIGMGLASSGAHEVLHTLGARHGNSYSAVGITSANYGNTGGLQATQVVSTGATGATENIKEVGRNISPWSKVVLDVAGGHSVGGATVVGMPVMSMLESGDAGNSVATATPTTLALGESSRQWISMIEGDLDGDGFDLDYFTFSAPAAGLFTADLYSIQRFNDAFEFNATLTLYDLDGVTPLLTVDDSRYGGNVFNSGVVRTLDPFFVNVPLLSAGDYTIEVKAADGALESAGDRYVLLMGLAVSFAACDFDQDGDCDPFDIDALYANFGSNDAAFDVDGDGSVGNSDIGAWLSEASSTSNPFNASSKTFVLGDVDFDGDVDSTDLGLLLNNFADTSGLLYGAGNLNDDSTVDSTDLGLLLNNFSFSSATSSLAVSAVPEPAGFALWFPLLLPILGVLSSGRRSP